MTTHSTAFLYSGYTFQQEQDFKAERERLRKEQTGDTNAKRMQEFL